MATATKYVTRKEFEPVKVGLEKLTIRAEVISFDLHRLTNQVADVAEDLGALHDVMEARFEALEARLDAADQTQAAILSAVMQLLPR